MSVPISDFALSACGTGESASMNMARNRAILDAKRQLADSIDSEISSRMEDFLKSTGMGSNEQVKQASEIVTKNTTIQAKLTGYKQINTKAFSRGNKYQFFVLLEYPVGRANQALMNEIKKDEYYRFEINISIEFLETNEVLKKRKIYKINSIEYGEIEGSFSIKDTENLNKNIITNSLKSINQKVSGM